VAALTISSSAMSMTVLSTFRNSCPVRIDFEPGFEHKRVPHFVGKGVRRASERRANTPPFLCRMFKNIVSPPVRPIFRKREKGPHPHSLRDIAAHRTEPIHLFSCFFDKRPTFRWNVNSSAWSPPIVIFAHQVDVPILMPPDIPAPAVVYDFRLFDHGSPPRLPRQRPGQPQRRAIL